MLSWVTRGVYLGTERNYLTVQVDDVFMDSERWDPVANAETLVRPLRMTQYDVHRAVLWSQYNVFRIDMAFNGEGSVEAGSRDQLTSARWRRRSTSTGSTTPTSHPNLDNLSYQEIKDEITQERGLGEEQGPADRPVRARHRRALGPVQPEHGAGDRPTRASSGSATTTRAVPAQWQLGPATSLPVTRPTCTTTLRPGPSSSTSTTTCTCRRSSVARASTRPSRPASRSRQRGTSTSTGRPSRSSCTCSTTTRGRTTCTRPTWPRTGSCTR